MSCSNEVSNKSQIKTDVVYLADDLLEGRQTGTEGEKKAANYIAKRFKDLGLLAQDVQSVMPESVTTTNNGTLAISSSGIIANLVAAVKDLKQQVEELTKQLKG